MVLGDPCEKTGQPQIENHWTKGMATTPTSSTSFYTQALRSYAYALAS